MSEIIEAESNFDLSLIDKVVSAANVIDIRDIEKQAAEEVQEVEQVTELPDGAIVLDIRSPDETDEMPLALDDIETITMPFFKLATQFGDLDQTKPYYLYCDRGVMSRLQALLLHEHGYTNVKVYRKN
ncbi:thiazole biosynthesis protein [Psychrosphaera algicola]|uniref:thiazole biosynthesis protein n=1 Tax=Psychrosphaera algicola TaxID=3023714 RepID=UPI00351CDC0B